MFIHTQLEFHFIFFDINRRNKNRSFLRSQKISIFQCEKRFSERRKQIINPLYDQRLSKLLCLLLPVLTIVKHIVYQAHYININFIVNDSSFVDNADFFYLRDLLVQSQNRRHNRSIRVVFIALEVKNAVEKRSLHVSKVLEVGGNEIAEFYGQILIFDFVFSDVLSIGEEIRINIPMEEIENFIKVLYKIPHPFFFQIHRLKMFEPQIRFHQKQNDINIFFKFVWSSFIFNTRIFRIFKNRMGYILYTTYYNYY